ncbi:MAG: hypothetical protein ACPG31_00285 [Planctomycetota bacterium]
MMRHLHFVWLAAVSLGIAGCGESHAEDSDPSEAAVVEGMTASESGPGAEETAPEAVHLDALGCVVEEQD